MCCERDRQIPRHRGPRGDASWPTTIGGPTGARPSCRVRGPAGAAQRPVAAPLLLPGLPGTDFLLFNTKDINPQASRVSCCQESDRKLGRDEGRRRAPPRAGMMEAKTDPNTLKEMADEATGHRRVRRSEHTMAPLSYRTARSAWAT